MPVYKCKSVKVFWYTRAWKYEGIKVCMYAIMQEYKTTGSFKNKYKNVPILWKNLHQRTVLFISKLLASSYIQLSKMQCALMTQVFEKDFKYQTKSENK